MDGASTSLRHTSSSLPSPCNLWRIVTEQGFIIVLVVGVVCAGVAYVLGRRQRDAALRQHGAAPLPAAAAAQRAEEPSDDPQTERGRPEPAGAEPTRTEPETAKITYEEDDDIDPTRVGAPGKRVILQPPLKRIVYDEDADSDEPTRAQGLFLVHAEAQTDKGLRRKRNEDSLLVLESENLFVVADGMGGYSGGELASQIAVKTIGMAYETRTFEGPRHEGVALEATNLARAIQMANAAILEVVNIKPELKGMGTTVCAARFAPTKNRMFIGHVGDSRCYRLRNGKFEQITADHTMAQEGVSGPDAAKLSRAVGVWPTVQIDISAVTPLPGDDYLICSDGLTKMLPDARIAEVLQSENEPTAAVEALIAAANESGGKDNVSVILVRVFEPRPPAQS